MMHLLCQEWIVAILKKHIPLVALAVRQRAKFEGWLKFELASYAEKEGAKSVQVEANYNDGKVRSDVAFHFNNTRYDLELKTPNTNWQIQGIESKTRPITLNLASIVNDAKKLVDCPGRGIVAFVLFPIPNGDKRWEDYLQSIAGKLEIDLSITDNCTRLKVPFDDGKLCEVIVCCFLYPKKNRTKKIRPTVQQQRRR